MGGEGQKGVKLSIVLNLMPLLQNILHLSMIGWHTFLQQRNQR